MPSRLRGRPTDPPPAKDFQVAGRVAADLAHARVLLVGFALEPIPHGTNSDGELVEERGAEDSVCIVIVPRLKLEGHSAQTTHHSRSSSPPRKRTKH